MKTSQPLLLPVVASLLLLAGVALPQQHRALHLGHPGTRFAPPLTKPEQVRTLLAGEELKPDVVSILQQVRWKGDLDDFRNAAATAPIQDLKLPIGTRMPFMSSRKDGKPIALMDVLWAGDDPVPAYAFDFTSKQRRYRCIIPKPCSNFYVTDVGQARPDLALECAVPGEVVIGRPFELCLATTNLGTATEPSARLSLKIPAGLTRIGGVNRTPDADGCFVWTIANLPPQSASRICATFIAGQPGQLGFVGAVKDDQGSSAESSCSTESTGIPAILLETADLNDPIEVGKEVTYEIKVTNQGTSPATNLKVICQLPDSEQFVSAEGQSQAQAQERTLTMTTLPELAPKARAVWRVRMKALKPDDARFKVYVSSDQFLTPILKDEATHLY